MSEVLTGLGLILGVLIAYAQIQRGQRASLLLQEAHLQNELKLRIYERVGAVLADAGSSISTAATQYISVLLSLRMHVESGFETSFRQTALELSDRTFEAHRAVTTVILLLEEYEMVFWRFGAFRNKLSESSGALLEAHTPFSSKLMLFLPMDHPKTGERFGPVSVPTKDELDELQQLRETFSAVCDDLAGYMIDLQIEAQNELLGDLFGRQLPPRNPADPAVTVLGRTTETMSERPKGRLV